VPETFLKQAEKGLGKATLAQLLSLCAGGLWIGHPALTYRAAGQGLTQGGPLVHRFLLARGQALGASWGPQEQQRARQCLRAARELASRARDMEVVRDASAALDKLPDWDMFDALLSGSPASRAETAVTPEEIAQVIDVERGSRKVPRFMAPTTPRRPRRARARRRGTRNLFDELLSFLEFEGKF
jgi:hypothetical protein